jgi:hypothetical protein
MAEAILESQAAADFMKVCLRYNSTAVSGSNSTMSSRNYKISGFCSNDSGGVKG